MTNAIAFDKLEVWLRCPHPRSQAGWRGCAIRGSFCCGLSTLCVTRRCKRHRRGKRIRKGIAFSCQCMEGRRKSSR